MFSLFFVLMYELYNNIDCYVSETTEGKIKQSKVNVYSVKYNPLTVKCSEEMTACVGASICIIRPATLTNRCRDRENGKIKISTLTTLLSACYLFSQQQRSKDGRSKSAVFDNKSTLLQKLALYCTSAGCDVRQ